MTEAGYRAPVVSAAMALQRAGALAGAGGRHILGIAGMPGAGKSTLARQLADQLGNSAIYVPMDGFHLANHELIRLGRRDRKGAIDTFDAAGFVHLLSRLHAADGEVVYAPSFLREIEEPIAGWIPISPDIPLVITEGNYLLVPNGPWARVRALLDETWYVEVDEDLRVQRLIARHEAFGKSPSEARRWAMGSDQVNAEFIARTRGRADVVVNVTPYV